MARPPTPMDESASDKGWDDTMGSATATACPMSASWRLTRKPIRSASIPVASGPHAAATPSPTQ